MLKDYSFYRLDGDDRQVYSLLGVYAMDKGILKQFDGYPILTDSDYQWFLAYHSNKLIGWASLKVSKNKVKFINVYVEPEYRHKGIHTELIWQRMDWCEKNGYRSIEVDCLTTSVNQYKKLGFKEVKTFKKWHKLTIELIIPEELGI